jgi:hypothetical protein
LLSLPAGGLVNYDLKSRIRPLLVETNVLIVKLTDISRIKFFGRAFLSTASPLGLELAKENKPANIHGIITAWFIIGFTDGEGTFGVYFIKKNKNLKLGMTFIPLFQIGVHKKDEELLKEIKEVGFKGIGSITYNKDMAFFKVQSLKDILTVVIPHFDKYPLMTQKRADYLLFREIAPSEIGSCLASKGGEIVTSGEQEQKYPSLDPLFVISPTVRDHLWYQLLKSPKPV